MVSTETAGDVEMGKPVSVAPGIWRLPLPMNSAPPHINSWLLEDGDGWLVVDCGTRSENTRAVWQSFMDSSLYRDGIRRIFLTHAHPDHAGSAPWLARETGAPVLMAREEHRALTNFLVEDERRDAEIEQWMREQGAGDEQIRLCQLFYQHFSRGCPEIQSEVRFVEPGDSITVGGREWQLHGGYGHTPCNLLMHHAGERLLITGDQILPEVVTHVGLWWRQSQRPLGPYLESLERLRTLPVDLAFPAHGDPFDFYRQRCDRLREVHDQRLKRIQDALAEGPMTMTDLLDKFGGKAARSPVFPLVAGQIYARLAYLREQERIELVRSEPEPTYQIRR